MLVYLVKCDRGAICRKKEKMHKEMLEDFLEASNKQELRKGEVLNHQREVGFQRLSLRIS